MYNIIIKLVLMAQFTNPNKKLDPIFTKLTYLSVQSSCSLTRSTAVGLKSQQYTFRSGLSMAWNGKLFSASAC